MSDKRSRFEFMLSTLGGRGYRELLTVLDDITYVVERQYDENRVADALENRLEGSPETDVSVLEVLFALSSKVEDAAHIDLTATNPSSVDWFWIFMENMDLDQFTDRTYDVDMDSARIRHIVDNWVHHRYDRLGNGTIFPMPPTYPGDMRTMELWYQMHAYLEWNCDY